MNKVNIFLPIEIKHRELLSKIFISFVACSYKIRIYIGTKNAINRLTIDKKGVLIYKGGLEYQKILKIKKKSLFVILDEEIGPACENFKKDMRMRVWPGSEKLIDRYYCIGHYGYNIGKIALPSLRKKMISVGWPRIDLWRNEMRYIYREKIDNIKRKYGDFILFASDFGYNSNKKITDTIKARANIGWTSVSEDIPDMKLRAQRFFQDYQKHIEWFQILDSLSDFPQIIIRPHPAEDHAEWRRVAKNFKRIKVVYEGEISPWIYAANALLHRGCTSAVQAYMAGIPAGYIVTKNEWIKRALPYDISEHLYNTEDIAAFCKKYIDHKPVPPKEYSAAFKNMVHIEKDKFASELIIEDMLKLGATPEPPYRITVKDRVYDVLLHVRKGINKARQYLFKQEQNIGIAPQSQKMPGGITKAEVEDFLHRIDPNRKFKVRQVFKDCVEIDE